MAARDAFHAGGVLDLTVSSVEETGLHEQSEWQLACRIASTRGFAKSDLLPRLLLYVTERTLLGHAAELTEQHLGTHIFNRAPGYDPGEDNIVRSYARTLRKRLDAFFAGEGAHEPLRLAIPRGGYAPVFFTTDAVVDETSVAAAEELDPVKASGELTPDEFAPCTPPAPPIHDITSGRPSLTADPQAPAVDCFHPLTAPARSEVRDTTAQVGASRRSAPWLRSTLVSAMLVLLGVLATLAAQYGLRLRHTADAASPAHPLWAELFTASRTTLIVPADSGISNVQNLSRELISLDDYASGRFIDKLHPAGIASRDLNDLLLQRYTSVADLEICATLLRLPELSGGHAEVRYARSINPDDLKRFDVVLLGSKHSNPWVALYEDRLNFQLEYLPETGRSFINNRHPRSGEQPVYDSGTLTYATVSFLPGLSGTGHALLIQGLNMAGTQAAADSLSNSVTIRPILRKAMAPDGSIRSFEYLIEARSVGANAPEARVVATRFP